MSASARPEEIPPRGGEAHRTADRGPGVHRRTLTTDESACTPGSVPAAFGGRWRPSISACRCRQALAAYPQARAGSPRTPAQAAASRRRPFWPCSGWGLPSHPGHPGCWWALTPPFHPYRRARAGGLFSVALSRGSPRVAVNNHPALWSPDVPRRRPEGRRRGRPADSSVAPTIRTARSAAAAYAVGLRWISPRRAAARRRPGRRHGQRGRRRRLADHVPGPARGRPAAGAGQRQQLASPCVRATSPACTAAGATWRSAAPARCCCRRGRRRRSPDACCCCHAGPGVREGGAVPGARRDRRARRSRTSCAGWSGIRARCQPAPAAGHAARMVGRRAVYGGYFGAALGVMLVAGAGAGARREAGPGHRREERAVGDGRADDRGRVRPVRPGQLGRGRGAGAGDDRRRLRRRTLARRLRSGRAQGRHRGLRHRSSASIC